MCAYASGWGGGLGPVVLYAPFPQHVYVLYALLTDRLCPATLSAIPIQGDSLKIHITNPQILFRDINNDLFAILTRSLYSILDHK